MNQALCSTVRRSVKEKLIEKERTDKEKLALEQSIKGSLVKSLEHEIFKTVAAFMNCDGRVLLIGVEDDGTICGVKKDFESFGEKKNRDGCNISPI